MFLLSKGFGALGALPNRRGIPEESEDSRSCGAAGSIVVAPHWTGQLSQ